ncbi:hypothetical protein IJH24_01980 [Candidatus Saccharibacteria bacterium]|nr:hypothetical protein [Candidatus Saccharibacteria bacterium]
MKKNISRWWIVALITLVFGLSFMPVSVRADEEEATEETAETTTGGTSISLEPVSKILQIASGETYKNVFKVNNDGDDVMRIEVYAAPYSYVYSDEEESYKLGFTNENNYTQMSRWITLKDSSGNYVERPTFAIEPHESLEITYKITTPNSIPSGGQYAVIFAHALNTVTTVSGVSTEPSLGMIIYGRSTEGESIIASEFSDLKIGEEDGKIFGSVKVKNTGNVDFSAKGVLKVDPIIGFGSYETPINTGRISVIPEAELVLSNVWEETPGFGIYRAIFTVSVGEETETTVKIMVRLPLFVIVTIIILLTFLTIWIIITVRKRKERRSRLAV